MTGHLISAQGVQDLRKIKRAVLGTDPMRADKLRRVNWNEDLLLAVALEDFTGTIGCPDMHGTCADYRTADGCHEAGQQEFDVTQVRAVECAAGTATTTQEPVLAGDILVCWRNKESQRWEVLQHTYQRCTVYCGWSASRADFLSVDTISGDMDFERLSGAILQTGDGEAIATATVRLSAFSTSPLTIICRALAELPEETGLVWCGLTDGPGVLLDLDAETISYVTLDSAGAVATTVITIPYPRPWGPVGAGYNGPSAKLGWCWLDCERLTILGETGAGAGVVTPVAHWPIDQPNVDCTLAFGSTVPSGESGILWDIKAICGSTCETCMTYDDWPTPGSVDITGVDGLTLAEDAPFEVTVPGDISEPAYTRNAIDPNGVEWIAFSGGSGVVCSYASEKWNAQWTEEDPEVFNDGVHRITATPRLLAWRTVPPVTVIPRVADAQGPAVVCYDEAAFPADSTGYWFVLAIVGFYKFEIASGQLVQIHSDGAVFAHNGALPQDDTPTSFSRVGVFHVESNWLGAGLFSSFSPCAESPPYIDIESWPDTIDLAWIPTAPECGSDPPTTSSTTGSTTTASSTTGSSTTETSTTTASSTTESSTTETSSTTESSTTANPCTGLCFYISVQDGCGGSPTGFSWSGNGNTCAGCGDPPCVSNLCTDVVTAIGRWPVDEFDTASLPCI